MAPFYFDADGDDLNYSISGEPSFVTIDGSVLTFSPGSISDILRSNNGQLSYSFSITISDGFSILDNTFGFTVIRANYTLAEGTTETFDLATVFQNADTYSISGEPSFITLNGSVLTFAPGFIASNYSPYTFKVTAHNSDGTITSVAFTLIVIPRLRVNNVGAIEGNTYEETITHGYSEDEAPTGYTLTLSDGAEAPEWITISDGKVIATPSYDVVESTATHEIFYFEISTTNKTPNATGDFIVTVINNSETPITYDGNLSAETVDEDNTGLYDILSHYTSNINGSLELRPNYPDDDDAGTQNDDHYNSNHPDWVSFPAGSIRVTPGNDEVGTHQIPFKVIDQIGNELTGILSLTVTNTNDAPVAPWTKPVIKVLGNLECWTIDSNITETFDLSTVFYDDDANDVLTYELIADDDPDDGHVGVVGNVKVSSPDFVGIENSTLNFNFTSESENYRGFHYIGIRVTDLSGGSVTSVVVLIVGSYSSYAEDPRYIVMTDCPDETTDDSGSSTGSKPASSKSVRLGGSAISTRAETIRERGVIYSASANNRESLIIGEQGVSKEAMTNSEDNSFSKKIKGLTADITYYYRAYAIGYDDVTTYGDVKDFILKTDITLGNEDFEKTRFTILPNPTSGILNITVVEKAGYSLFSITGKTLKKGTLATGKSEIDISYFAKGVYFLNIKTGKGSFTKKVVRN